MNSTEFQDISGVIPPPSGVKPNFEHPESLGYRIIIASVICWFAATLFVFLRLYTRQYIIRIIAVEDCKHSGLLQLGTNLTDQEDVLVVAWVCTLQLQTVSLAKRVLMHQYISSCL
jgi:hypothetical protein